jgi:hypothetical protein
LRFARLNRLFARRDGGTFQLRFDDTDQERSREEYVEGIREDLRWLGSIGTPGRANRSASRDMLRRWRRGKAPAGYTLATKRRMSWSAAASASSRRGFRSSMTARR